jgi:hypothetical protein
MNNWYGEYVPNAEHFCSSTACIAGWGAVLAGWKPVYEKFTDLGGKYEWTGYVEKGEDQRDPSSVAAEIFDLEYDLADYLFYEIDSSNVLLALDILIEYPDIDEEFFVEKLKSSPRYVDDY